MGNRTCCEEELEFELKTNVNLKRKQKIKKKTRLVLRTHELDLIQDLTRAALKNDVAMVQHIIEGRYVDVQTRLLIQPPERTLLHIAADYCYIDLLDYLLTNHYNKSAAEIDVLDSMGWTPLMCAIYSKNIQCVIKLIRKGADITLMNNAGQTAFSLAKQSGDNQIIRIFEQLSENKTIQQILQEDYSQIEEAQVSQQIRVFNSNKNNLSSFADKRSKSKGAHDHQKTLFRHQSNELQEASKQELSKIQSTTDVSQVKVEGSEENIVALSNSTPDNGRQED